jgi:hypothetical protein
MLDFYYLTICFGFPNIGNKIGDSCNYLYLADMSTAVRITPCKGIQRIDAAT